ncbi:unnamed protein product, partial [Closterium sp. Naga37s-1]
TSRSSTPTWCITGASSRGVRWTRVSRTDWWGSSLRAWSHQQRHRVRTCCLWFLLPPATPHHPPSSTSSRSALQSPTARLAWRPTWCICCSPTPPPSPTVRPSTCTWSHTTHPPSASIARCASATAAASPASTTSRGPSTMRCSLHVTSTAGHRLIPGPSCKGQLSSYCSLHSQQLLLQCLLPCP